MAAKLPGAPLLLLLALSCLALRSQSRSDQRYSEQLFLKHLPDARVAATFQFKTVWDIDPLDFSRPGSGEPSRHTVGMPLHLRGVITAFVQYCIAIFGLQRMTVDSTVVGPVARDVNVYVGSRGSIDVNVYVGSRGSIDEERAVLCSLWAVLKA